MNNVYGECILEAFGKKDAQDDAMTVRQAEKYYKTMVKKCATNAQTKKEIDDCIKTLEKCVDDMRSARTRAELDLRDKDRIKYALSSTLPLNGVIKCIQRNNWEKDLDDQMINKINLNTPVYIDNDTRKKTKTAATAATTAASGAMVAKDVAKVATTANPVGLVKKGATFGFKFAMYEKMLTRNIDKTNEAIEYLKEKRKNLDNKKG